MLGNYRQSYQRLLKCVPKPHLGLLIVVPKSQNLLTNVGPLACINLFQKNDQIRAKLCTLSRDQKFDL